MSKPRLLLHSNAGAAFGMGHLMRCIALAEEALAHDWAVRWGGDLDGLALGLLSQLDAAALVEPIPAADVPGWLADQVTDWKPDVLHVDSYLLSSADLPRGGHLLSSMHDGTHGEVNCDLAIDGNLGAEVRVAGRARCRDVLLGTDVVPVRRQVLAQRLMHVPTEGRPRVLVVMGGTDPLHLTAPVLSALDHIASELDVTVVTPEDQAADIFAISERSRHTIKLVRFVSDLPATASQHDLVISAAGTSVWDFACMGVPMALVCAVGNQADSYRAVLDAGLAVGLGFGVEADLERNILAVGELVFDAERLAEMSQHSRAIVDGLGAWRIVSAWRQLIDPTIRRIDTSPAGLVARPATLADAVVLHSWRNDSGTRSASRSVNRVPWGSHLEWLTSSLVRKDRQLLVVERDGQPVGTVRWDFVGGRDWEVSVTVAPECRGQGLAAPILRVGESALRATGAVRLRAVIHEDNTASRRAFASVGYLPHLPPDTDCFLTAVRWRVPD